MVFKKGNKINFGRKRPDVTKRNLEDNPMHHKDAKIKSSATHKKLYYKKESHPRYGTEHRDISKEKISVSKKIYYKSEEGTLLKEKLSTLHRGKHRSPTTEIKKGQHLSHKTEFKKGGTPWSKGMKGLIIGYKFPKGKEHPNWNNGSSFIPYTPEFNNELKEFIRNKFNRVCQLCGSPENGTKLAVHHINYKKEDCREENLIPLCSTPCNVRVNFNRNYWEQLFTKMLNSKVG